MIPAGSTTSEGITFPTINDTAFEEDETFIVVGTVVAGTTSNATTRGTGTIISNEIFPNLRLKFPYGSGCD